MNRDNEIVIKVYKGLLEKKFDPVSIKMVCDHSSFNESLLDFIKQYRKYGIAAFGDMSFISEASFWLNADSKTEEELEKTVIYIVTEEVNNEK